MGTWIGTSGWHYSHWKGAFYPADLPSQQWLAYYAAHFRTVEINNSFYKLPGEETFRTWRSSVPEGFVFAVKASRFITHMKKLTDPTTSTALFFERIALLGEKLGPILFQLPPRWRANPERLNSFLAALPGGHRYAFEFRDADWMTTEIYQILERHHAALCVFHFNRQTAPLQTTADFAYIRLHGPGGPYQGSYSSSELEEWARIIDHWTSQGQAVYSYFDNDMAGFAPHNALELRRLLANEEQKE